MIATKQIRKNKTLDSEHNIDEKLSCRRETARCLMSLKISLSHSRLFEMALLRKA